MGEAAVLEGAGSEVDLDSGQLDRIVAGVLLSKR